MKFSKSSLLLIFIILILINIISFYFLGESIKIADTLEHLESDTTEKILRFKKNLLEYFIYTTIILDFGFLMLIIYSILKKHQSPNIKHPA
ncbi:hypothetical protein MASR1M29_11560 [Cloacibacterium normanense]|jgi:uncharacterized membrane protein